jgi:hypothetical protein
LIAGLPELVQGIAWPAGSIIDQLTLPVGIGPDEAPITVVVRIVVPPRVGEGEAATEIAGIWLEIVTLIWVLLFCK